VSDDHSSFDELADLDEGLLAPSRADEVRAHLVGCADCRARHQALRDVHDELAVLPPETMPPAVTQRLDRALAGAALPRSATVVPIARHRRRQPWPALAGVAAAVVVLGFVVAVGVGAFSGGGATSDGGSGSAGSTTSAGARLPQSTGHFTTTVSPRTFTHASLPAEVRRLVSGRVAALGEPASSAAPTTGIGGGNGRNKPAVTGSSANLPRALRPMFSSPTTLLNCAASLTDQKGEVPLAVEFARYTTAAARNAPSALFVFPFDSTHVVVYVAGPTCTGLEHIREFVKVPIG
jgi:hypothetical protein